MIPRIFGEKKGSRFCSGNSHVTSPRDYSSRKTPFEGLLKPAFISRNEKKQRSRQILQDIFSGISGNVFAHPNTSSSAPYPHELNSTWKKTIEGGKIHMSKEEKSGRPERDPI